MLLAYIGQANYQDARCGVNFKSRRYPLVSEAYTHVRLATLFQRTIFLAAETQYQGVLQVFEAFSRLDRQGPYRKFRAGGKSAYPGCCVFVYAEYMSSISQMRA